MGTEIVPVKRDKFPIRKEDRVKLQDWQPSQSLSRFIENRLEVYGARRRLEASEEASVSTTLPQRDSTLIVQKQQNPSQGIQAYRSEKVERTTGHELAKSKSFGISPKKVDFNPEPLFHGKPLFEDSRGISKLTSDPPEPGIVFQSTPSLDSRPIGKRKPLNHNKSLVFEAVDPWRDDLHPRAFSNDFESRLSERPYERASRTEVSGENVIRSENPERLAVTLADRFSQDSKDPFSSRGFTAELVVQDHSFTITPIELEPLSFEDALEAPFDVKVNLLVNGAARLEKRKHEPPPLTSRETKVLEKSKGQILKALDEIVERGTESAGRLIASRWGKTGLSFAGMTGLALASSSCSGRMVPVEPNPLEPTVTESEPVVPIELPEGFIAGEIEKPGEPAQEMPFWTPPTLEQALVIDGGGEIPESIQEYDFEGAIRSGFVQAGTPVAEQIDFRSLVREDEYRFVYVARDTSGNILWAKLGEGTNERFSDYPLHLNPVPGVGYVLETEVVWYVSIPESNEADIIWGGSDGTLPILAKDIRVLPDGRQAFSKYWDIQASEWKDLGEVVNFTLDEGVIVDTKVEILSSTFKRVEQEGKSVRFGDLTLVSTNSFIQRHGGMMYPDFEMFPKRLDFDSDPVTKSATSMLDEALGKTLADAHAAANRVELGSIEEADRYYEETFKPLLEEAKENGEPLMISWVGGKQVDATKGVELVFTPDTPPSWHVANDSGYNYQVKNGQISATAYLAWDRFHYRPSPTLGVWFTLSSIASPQARNHRLPVNVPHHRTYIGGIFYSLFKPGLTDYLPDGNYPGAVWIKYVPLRD